MDGKEFSTPARLMMLMFLIFTLLGFIIIATTSEKMYQTITPEVMGVKNFQTHVVQSDCVLVNTLHPEMVQSVVLAGQMFFEVPIEQGTKTLYMVFGSRGDDDGWRSGDQTNCTFMK